MIKGSTIGGNSFTQTQTGIYTLGSATSNAYSPLVEPEILAWWDADTLSSGAVSSWADRAGSLALIQATGANQPTKSATAFTDMFGVTHPGVVFGGTHILSCAAFGGVVLGRTSLTMLISVQDTTTAAAIMVELSTNALSNNGAFWLAANDASSQHTLEPLGMGGPGCGPGTWRSTNNTAPLVDPGVIAIRYDLTTGFGSNVRELDNVALDGTQTATALLTTIPTMPNLPLFVGARSGLVAPWTGKIRDLIFLTGNADAEARVRVAAFMGARVGAPQA